MKKCVLCLELQPETEFTNGENRCKPCNSLRAKIRRRKYAFARATKMRINLLKKLKVCLECHKCLELNSFQDRIARRGEIKYDCLCRNCRNQTDKPVGMSQRKQTKLWRRYKLTLERYLSVLVSQGYCCAICKRDKSGGKGGWHVDHDHACCPGEGSCGKCIRGLLCASCNLAMGMMRDNPVAFRAAADYLEAYSLKESQRAHISAPLSLGVAGNVCQPPFGLHVSEVAPIECAVA